MPIDQKIHDLALAYVNYQLSIEIRDTDAEHDEEIFFEMYKSAHNRFSELIRDAM